MIKKYLFMTKKLVPKVTPLMPLAVTERKSGDFYSVKRVNMLDTKSKSAIAQSQK